MEQNGGSTPVRIQFPKDSPPSDPLNRPVLIVGQLPNLNRITFKDVKHKLEPRVTEEVYNLALKSLHPSTSDSVPLYVGLATLASLPGKCSRHNAPSRPHSLTSIVKSTSSGVDETILVVCRYEDVLPSAAAIARAYPIYSRKTGGSGCWTPTTNMETPATGKEGRGGKKCVPGDAGITIRVEFLLVEPPSLRPSAGISHQALETLSEAVRDTARIVDSPCSEMNVDHFLQEVSKISQELNSDGKRVELKVIRGEELKAKGMGGIYGVGRAAEIEPALAVLSYLSSGTKDSGEKGSPDKQSEKPVIAWVGKGIVYDTGGLSLKTKTIMPGMKRDCGGAAAILNAFRLAVKTGFQTDLHAVFCLAENSVGPRATRPDDVHTLYSGRTVEINNTDAEGRLVLADGVVYACRDLKADVILDMATLTGAQGVATGKYHGAALSNDREWERKAFEAGRASGDLVFPIPYCPELHFVEFNSAIADMKNSVGDRGNAQSSCAGLFILAHLGFDFPGKWLHIDMASPVHSGERGTGYGVALLSLLFGDYFKDGMIQGLTKGAFSVDDNNDKPPTANTNHRSQQTEKEGLLDKTSSQEKKKG